MEAIYRNIKFKRRDNFNLLSLTDQELYDYLTNLTSKYKSLLIDEIQIYLTWNLIMKNLYDKFVVTN